MSVIWITILLMAAIGLVAAVLLYVAAKKFYVYEDPRIAQVEELLPGANCGSCGYSGCHAFAVACCSAKSLENMNCPGASGSMPRIGEIVGLAAGKVEAKVAVLACDGACSLRPVTSAYEGTRSCALEASVYSGTTACAYGCLGCGDCVESCNRPGHRPSRRRLRQVRGLRPLRRRLSAPSHAARAKAQAAGVRGLQQPRQGRRGNERMRSGLHRLRQVHARMPVESGYRQGLRGTYRPDGLHSLRNLPGGLSEKEHPE